SSRRRYDSALAPSILVSILWCVAANSDGLDRWNRRATGRSFDYRDQQRHRDKRHGRNDSWSRGNSGSDRQFGLRGAIVHAHDGVLLSAPMKKWLYGSGHDVDQAPIDRLRQFPREPDMLVYGLRSLGALIIRGLLRIYNHFEIIGHQNLRTNRSLVIVANHCSHIDTLCLLAALPLRKLH